MDDKNFKQKTDKIKELEKKSQEYLQGWQRAKADYINFKKEAAKKTSGLSQLITDQFLLELMPIMDDFNQAVAFIPEDQKKADWVVGIINLQKKFEELLKAKGLEAFDSLGQKFDPNFHEAVAQQAEKNKPPDIVIKEISKGYKKGGQIIRPAKVIVSQ